MVQTRRKRNIELELNFGYMIPGSGYLGIFYFIMNWKLDESWRDKLKPEFEKEYFQWMYDHINKRYNETTVYPKKDEIFAALNLTKLSDVKVVIVGQDPYHDGSAHGLSFSTTSGKTPPSLRNIFKELINEYGPNNVSERTYNNNLEDWSKQGVLLLNRTLTVEAANPNSHSKLGWNKITDKIIQLINEQDKPIVYMLWGNNAKQLKSLITNPKHKVLESAHPSPLSANRGFFGNDHFFKCNDYLKAMGMNEIIW